MVETNKPSYDEQCKPSADKKDYVGKWIAGKAIEKMKAEAEALKGQANDDGRRENGLRFDDEDVDYFLSECESKDINPLDVISHVAKEEKIVLSGECPKDDNKRETYSFLRAVVERLATVFVLNKADRLGFGVSSVLNKVLGGIDRKSSKEGVRRGNDRSDYGEDDGDSDKCNKCAADGICIRTRVSW